MSMSDQATDLDKCKVPELKARCKQLGITGYSKLSKQELVQRIRASSPAAHAARTVEKPTNISPQAIPVISDDVHNLTPPVQLDPTRLGHPTKDEPTTASSEHFSVQPQYKSQAHLSSPKANTPAKRVAEEEHNPIRISSLMKSTRKCGKVEKRRPFQALQVTIRECPPQQVSPRAPRDPDLSTKASRIAWIKCLFVEHMFNHLDKHRRFSQHNDLAFQGLAPQMYEEHYSPEAFAAAIRFWIARLHSLMSLGSGQAWSSIPAGGLGPDIAGWPQVKDCRLLVDGFWLIEIETSDRYICLGSTGEVLGSSCDKSKGLPVEGVHIREDWARFITTRRESGNLPILSLVKTKDTHASPGGISKLWTAKSNDYVQQIAARAVLSSCAANSFSGDKLSATMMDTIALGHPASSDTRANQTIDIYLAESLQVLSVHLSTHDDLAIIQRANGVSHYVLRQTGQVVGDEDSGVAPLWQGLLGCDESGRAVDAKSFWEGWQQRASTE